MIPSDLAIQFMPRTRSPQALTGNRDRQLPRSPGAASDAQVQDAEPLGACDRAEALLAPTLSVVVPCHDEEAVLLETHRRLTATCRSIGVSYELVFVDDGSRDRTRALLETLGRGDPRVRMVGLSRNFGHQTAVTAGMDHAAGSAVVLIDADLQDPPELIPDMLRHWQDGIDVVYAVRRMRRGESWWKRLTARIFYRLLSSVSSVPIPHDTGDFRLIDRRVVDVIAAMPERDRFLRGMIAWVGFRQLALPYDRDRRFAGSSKYPLRRMIALAVDGVLSFSARPLRLATWMGLLVSCLAMYGVLYALCVRLFTHTWVSGWAFLAICVLFLGGVQLACLGIMGEYLGRVYAEVKRRPLYLVDRLVGTAPRRGPA